MSQGGASNAGFGSAFEFDPVFGAVSPNSRGMGNGSMNSMGMTNSMGMGGFGMGRLGMGMGMGMSFGGNRGFGNMNSQQQQKQQMRTTVKLGFDPPAPSAQVRTQAARVNLSRLPEPQRFAGINVELIGRKAVASGKISKAADADLLKQLLLLEPGVFEVDLSGLAGSQQQSSSRNNSAYAEEVPAQ
jgi:hypothetical protein